MGKSQIIPKVIRRSKTGQFIAAWHTKNGTNVTGYGMPNEDNLRRWRNKFNQSCKPGGYNEHLGINGMINYKIEIYNQKTGEILATYNPPMFETLD